MPSPNPSTYYETLFHSSSLNLVIPEISSLPEEPSGTSDKDDLGKWWEDVEGSSPTRESVFFDEKLFYFLSMHLPDEILRDLPGTPAIDAKEPTSEMLRLLGRLQLSMTASFIPSLPPPNPRSTFTPTSSIPISTSSSSLAPPAPPRTPLPSSSTSEQGSNPPVTPNPFPAMSQGEEQYANVEGVVVWEGAVEEVSGPWEEGNNKTKLPTKGTSGSGRKVIRVKDGWEIIWRGEVPIAYVRTQIQNPLLALTASVTLRDQTHSIKTHRRNAQSIDTSSIRSGTTVRTEGTDYEGYEDDDGDEYAVMEQIDLLGGLAGGEDIMPATRLASSIRQDLSIHTSSSSENSPLPLSAMTPLSAPSIVTPSTTSTEGIGPSREKGNLPSTVQPIISTTLRKSYRRVLSLSPGLRVRMRTLFLPQLLTSNEVDEEEGEKCVILCIEIENSLESSLDNGFEVNKVNLEISGKGGKVSTELIENTGFPLRLGSIEQYNLLYKVKIASSPSSSSTGHGDTTGKDGVEEIVNKSLGRTDEIRPVSIIVIGKPFTRINQSTGEDKYKYQTKEFHSRWNCSLDLSSFHHEDKHNLPAILPKSHNASNRNSKTTSLPASNSIAIAGDKRYSLAHLLTLEKEKETQHRKPLMPSQMINHNQRVTSLNAKTHQPHQENGLLVSIKLLPSASSGSKSNSAIQPLETFSIEIFVHNRSDQIKRFRLNVPSRDTGSAGVENRLREIWDKRKKLRKGQDDADWGVDDTILKQSLSSHSSTSPSIIPLENDIRCGPLLPCTSLSTRIKFLALRKGLHKIDKLRVISNDNEFDFMISPVLDIVVG
ncbi:hypothetical protein L486_01442 [Kwoniella mangroviensis CBS 10435]|uniref:Trafficking protein particle complex II-specific subunit 65 IgD3 domain-containing protein n=1 Tax=Kwoniella mangroviensis CBS 10435 TaxID=1331196 RepID=A0A1B9J1W9_9TREE|nr:hypothetical protein L486_01442 [Kwoniella mangroviensis CBS 10435]